MTNYDICQVIPESRAVTSDPEDCFLGQNRLKIYSCEKCGLVVSDKCLAFAESVGECFEQARWQRCTVHFYRNVFSVVPRGKMKEVAAMLKAIHAQEDLAEATKKAEAVAD